MNIFALDANPVLAARYHCDKHVVKMVTESAQILSTVLREAGVDHPDLYKSTHANHPCVKWAGENRSNFAWLLNLMVNLLGEYDRRYDGAGKFLRPRKMAGLFARFMWELPEGDQTPFALAMPEPYRSEDAIASYRRYYKNDKADLAKWKCGAPEWWTNE